MIGTATTMFTTLQHLLSGKQAKVRLRALTQSVSIGSAVNLTTASGLVRLLLL